MSSWPVRSAALSVLRRGAGGCPPEDVADYLDGRLPVSRTQAWDRHLITCTSCLARVQSERRLHAAMRDCVRPDGALHRSLLAMGQMTSSPAPAVGDHAPSRAPWEANVQREDLTVLSPGAPACHRSAARAVLLATVAAGAAGAAAWSVGVASVPVDGTRAPAVTPARPAVAPGGPASGPTSSAPSGVAAFVSVRVGLHPPAGGKAQSTP